MSLYAVRAAPIEIIIPLFHEEKHYKNFLLKRGWGGGGLLVFISLIWKYICIANAVKDLNKVFIKPLRGGGGKNCKQ